MTGLLRALLLTGGTLSMGLAVAGALLPLIPATPFLLIAAYCYARSSERAHRWLTTHRLFGPYITNFQRGRSHSKAQIALTLGTLWISTLITAIFIVDIWWARILFLVPLTLFSVYMLSRSRSTTNDPDPVLSESKHHDQTGSSRHRAERTDGDPSIRF